MAFLKTSHWGKAVPVFALSIHFSSLGSSGSLQRDFWPTREPPFADSLRRLAKTLPMLISVSATTPNPTQRSIPSSLLYRQRFSPCRRFSTLIRPLQPVLHFCPLRNQRFFWCARRAALLVGRLGIDTRFTPIRCAPRSLRSE